MWKKLDGTWKAIGGLIGLITIIALAIAVIQLRQSQSASKTQDIAQSTQIVVLQEQLEVQREMATLQASSSGSGPASTLVANQLSELQSTAIALSTREASIKQAGDLVVDENFDDGTDNGFFYESGNWAIVDAGSGNKVLEAGKSNDWSGARFGPVNFSDGTIAYRFKLLEYDSSEQSAITFLSFREGPQASYIFAADTYYSTLDFKYTGNDTSNKWVDIENGTVHFNFQNNKWYSVQVTAIGNRISVYLDQRLVIDTNDSRLTNGQIKFGSGSSSIAVQFDEVRVWTTSGQ